MNANFTEITKFHPWVLALAIAGLLTLPLSGCGGMQDRVTSGGEEETDWTLAKGNTEIEEEEVDWALAKGETETEEEEVDWTLANNEDKEKEDETDWTLA